MRVCLDSSHLSFPFVQFMRFFPLTFTRWREKVGVWQGWVVVSARIFIVCAVSPRTAGRFEKYRKII